MNKKMREIRSEIENKIASAKTLMADGESKNVEKAENILSEIDALEKEYAVEEKLFNLEKANLTPEAIKSVENKFKTEKQKNSVKEFANAARNGFKVKSMNEGSNADGGYIVPDDISTKINEYRDAKDSLLSEVRVTSVKTKSGARTFKKKSQHKGFSIVGEGAKIGKTETPQFERMEYSIKKKAGYLPVTNELLEDSDENLTKVITEWFGDESRTTANKDIIAAISKVKETEFADLDDIQKALIVTLGSAYRNTSKVYTNDDGLFYLSTLKDKMGRPICAASPTDPTKMSINAGPVTVPVKPYDNDVLPTVDGKIPFFVGDLHEAVELFDRKLLTIDTSATATVGELNAYEEDLTIFRGIERNDIVLRDKDAVVNGYIDISEKQPVITPGSDDTQQGE